MSHHAIGNNYKVNTTAQLLINYRIKLFFAMTCTHEILTRQNYYSAAP